MKKLIVRLVGGQGSQLYGVYRGYLVAKATGRELILDIASYSNGYIYPYTFDYFCPDFQKLDYLFSGDGALANNILPEEFIKEVGARCIDIHNIPLKQLIKKSKEYKNEVLYFLTDGTYSMEEEFPGHHEFRQLLKPQKNTLFRDAFQEEIKDKTAVGVFFRREEYISLGIASDYLFYKAGIQYYREKHPDAIFYLFSDDLEHVKETLGNQEDFRYVRLVGGADAHLETLLCLADCDHRLIGRTNYSMWSWYLRTKESSSQIYDASIVNFPPKLDKHAVYFQEADIQSYSKQWKNDPRKNENLVANTLDGIKKYLDQGEIEEAQQLLLALSFDSFHVSLEQRDVLTHYFEQICAAKGDFVRLDQCLSEHLPQNPESSAINHSLVMNKLMQNKALQATFYAAHLCMIDPSADMASMMEIMFLGTGYEETFAKLRKIPKFHFVLRSNFLGSHFSNHHDGALIWLKRMGHTVSLIDCESHQIDFEKEAYDRIERSHFTAVKTLARKSSGPLEYYPVFQDRDSKRDSLATLLNLLQEKSAEPVIFINRHVETDLSAVEVPTIYWDFSTKKDRETRDIQREFSYSDDKMPELDKKMCRGNPAVITVDPNKVPFYENLVGKDRVHCAKPYETRSYQFIDGPVDFDETIISHDDLLHFTIELAELANKIAKK